MDATVTAILENAKRLLDDAQSLAMRGSIRSAMSLSVLSLEESGKACLVRWKKAGYLVGEIADDIRTLHTAKQRVLAAYRGLKAIRSVGVIKLKEDISQEEWAGKDELFDEVVRHTLSKGLHVPKSQAELGLLDHVKQMGFYIDVDENLVAIPASVPPTAEWYDVFREDAEDGIRMAESDDQDHHIMSVLYSSLGKPSLFGSARRQALALVLERLRAHSSQADEVDR